MLFFSCMYIWECMFTKVRIIDKEFLRLFFKIFLRQTHTHTRIKKSTSTFMFVDWFIREPIDGAKCCYGKTNILGGCQQISKEKPVIIQILKAHARLVGWWRIHGIFRSCSLWQVTICYWSLVHAPLRLLIFPVMPCVYSFKIWARQMWHSWSNLEVQYTVR